MLAALADDVPILGGTEIVDEEALGDEILVGPQDGMEPTLANPVAHCTAVVAGVGADLAHVPHALGHQIPLRVPGVVQVEGDHVGLRDEIAPGLFPRKLAVDETATSALYMYSLRILVETKHLI